MNGPSPTGVLANGAADFWIRLDESLADGTCLGTTLSKRRPATDDIPEKFTVRPTVIKGAAAFQWISRRANRELHENLSPAETAKRIRELLQTSYEHAHVFTTAADFEVRVGSDAELTVRRSRPTKSAAAPEHNRSKSYLIPENVPCPFLAEIGVMTPAGKVRASKYAKFRQINRFLELVNDVAEHLPPTGDLRIVDFGCGKSYLTFALHHLLTRILERQVHILGLDRNSEVVATCARLSKKLDCRGLDFRVGEIAGQTIEDSVDLAVSLHACDSATDDALAQAVAWQAVVILAVPCCQHELSREIQVRDLAPITQQGILHEQFASLATDALRAQALEACGYKTQVIEFIDLEHTAKNLMIRAVRRSDGRRQQEALNAYDQFKTFLGLGQIASDRILAAAVREPAQS
jgi:SAM-dependent methyltransferase